MLRYRLFTVLVQLILLQPLSSYANSLIPVEEFARLPVVSNPKLSPDGKRVAMTIVADGKPLVVVQPLAKELKDRRIGKISLGDLYIHNYHWANNTRIILAARTSLKAHGGRRSITRLLAVNWDGSNPVPLEMQTDQWGYFYQYPKVLATLPEDNEHILALLDSKEDGWAQPHVHKVNIYTGEKSFHQISANGIQSWKSDQHGTRITGERLGTQGSSTAKTYYKKNMDSDWSVLQEADYFDHNRIIPFKFHEDKANILVVSKQELNEDDWNTVDEAERELFEYDLETGLIIGEYKNLKLEQQKSRLEKALPAMEISLQSEDLKKEHYIFKAFADKSPTTYYLINTVNNSLQRLGREYPSLEGVPLAEMKEFSYSARDGLNIPAFLTLPPNSKNNAIPLIVYPHGGPWYNDEWGFDSWVQYFASRGYAVLQPQYRGSTGYGIEHEEAGYKKWGAEMQDDITDGVLYLIEQGVVDKDRVCIVGASYGGYAAAWALIKTPDLFRCGISINGVLSMAKRAGKNSKVLFSDINRQLFNDSAELSSFSPSYNAEKIQSPLLLIASKKDTVVPYSHSKNMYKKMKKAGKDVEYLELKDGEHWRTNEANEIKILKAVDAFLKKHLPTAIHN